MAYYRGAGGKFLSSFLQLIFWFVLFNRIHFFHFLDSRPEMLLVNDGSGEPPQSHSSESYDYCKPG